MQITCLSFNRAAELQVAERFYPTQILCKLFYTHSFRHNAKKGGHTPTRKKRKKKKKLLPACSHLAQKVLIWIEKITRAVFAVKRMAMKTDDGKIGRDRTGCRCGRCVQN